jgi:hypothetical protein
MSDRHETLAEAVASILKDIRNPKPTPDVIFPELKRRLAERAKHATWLLSYVSKGGEPQAKVPPGSRKPGRERMQLEGRRAQYAALMACAMWDGVSGLYIVGYAGAGHTR